MTIERIIEIFNDHDRISGILLYGNSEDDSLFNSETIETMNNINVILHKYQEIQSVYNKFANTQYEHIGMQEIGKILSQEENK